VDLSYSKSKNLTPYDVLTIASMIEKEVIAPEERALVSAVIYNRLKSGMVLGIDATIRYALNVPGNKSLLQSELNNPTPYNTRLHAGLPPTPIANPGLASMQAAAHPAHVNYLYFVRKPDHVHHFFTASGAEFNRKACEYGYGCG
jgi:peptidoglycan lytic transglycosylase G